MRTSKLLAACALGTSLIAGSALYAPAFAQTATTESTQVTPAVSAASSTATPAADQRMKRSHRGDKMKNVDTSKWMDIKAVYDKVEAAGYKDVNSIKRTPKGYFVSAINAEGNWAKLRVDPIKGDIQPLERKGKGKGHHDKHRS